MKVCVLGVGRSGTTALYVLLQEILLREFGESVDFVYEPFWWDRDTFNKRWPETHGKFDLMQSLSSEGMFHHQSLPLFTAEPRPYAEHAWLQGLFQPRTGKEHLLSKIIRGCGRIPALNAVAGECAFVFILRHPLDVVNSILTRFSFFGGMYHRDDFPRFVQEVEALQGERIDPLGVVARSDREALFWLHMNRFALRALRTLENRVLIFSYEDFVRRPEVNLQRLCDGLGIKFQSDYTAVFERRVGTKTEGVYLKPAEIERLRPMHEAYLSMLREQEISCDVDWSTALKRFETGPFLIDEGAELHGKTPAFLIRTHKALALELRNLHSQFKQHKQLAKELEAHLRTKFAEKAAQYQEKKRREKRLEEVLAQVREKRERLAQEVQRLQAEVDRYHQTWTYQLRMASRKVRRRMRGKDDEATHAS